ncbi:MAG: LysR family transcriptional regulator [Desulfovibrionaceae bacterium]|nr:LysR family transcriptional regulator [Desulfovibrionaceae bacterium]MBF0513030.1 LysR family transcriptional regulator [Desulfovibrionaceae bacterium]
MQGCKPKVKVRVWLETAEGVYFGAGRMRLLKQIDELGSLRAAATALAMSYRAAWGKIKRTEEVIGRPLIEKAGCNREGYSLTPFGRQLLERFERFQAALEESAGALAADVLDILP